MVDVKPLNVSPVIKTARWSFLFLGFLYGVRRKKSLEEYEKTASIERHMKLQQKLKKDLELQMKTEKRDLKNLLLEIGVTDIPSELND